MATSLKEQEELFKVMGGKLGKKIEAFVIGGSAMLYYGAKDVTKDIDIVLKNKKERDVLVSTLEELGFNKRSTRLLYFEKKNVPVLLQRDEERIDIFYDKVIDFKFTDSMEDRVTASYEYGNLIIKVISHEDIIVLKCATERAGDRLDAASLMKIKNIDWDIIMDEAVIQMKIIGDVIPLSLFEFMCELKEDLKVDISQQIIDKLGDIAEKHLEKKIKSGDFIKVTEFKH